MGVFLLLFLMAAVFYSCKRDVVEIKFYDAAQAEIIVPDGTRVLIDAINASKLTAPMTAEDIVLFTHMHSDHYSADLAEQYAVKKLLFKKGIYEKDGIRITAIPSVHHNLDKITDENATNYIFLVEANGFRICHLGDIGQDHFTEEQLALLGDIDICFTQIENRASNMTMMNRKGFALIDELKPKIVIPTHFKEKSLEYAIANYSVFAGSEDLMAFHLADLPANTTFIIMGSMAAAYGSVYDLQPFE